MNRTEATMQTLGDLMGDYEAELIRAAQESERRRLTPGTIEYAQDQRVAAERAQLAALMETMGDEDEDEDEDEDYEADEP